jgi:hypothetical protein
MPPQAVRDRVASVADCRPPAAPWQRLGDPPSDQAFVSFYISDDLARWPVRAITLPKNNKSDPNLETLTYGLFSTCEPKMRAGIVNRHVRHVIFLTRIRDRGRYVTGYYELGWYARGSLWPTTRDFALAANRARFVDPIPVTGFSGELGDALQRKWRSYILLDAESSAELVATLSAATDRTSAYLAEVDRLERINLYLTGYRYVSWKRTEPWGWNDAEVYLPGSDAEPSDASPNVSPSGRWRCRACGEITTNEALLKLCPNCRNRGTLRPLKGDKIEEGDDG